MLIPGKLYRYNLNIPLSFYMLTEVNFMYKRAIQKITVDQNTLHLFLGNFPVLFGQDKHDNLIFMVHNKIIGRSLWDESYMVQVE